MDGKSLAQLALTFVAVIMCGYMTLRDQDDGDQLDQDATVLAEANRDQINALRDDIQDLAKTLKKNNVGDPGLDARDVNRLIKDAIAMERSALSGASSPKVEDIAESSEEEDFNLGSAMEKFMSIPDDYEGRQALWAQIKKAGKLDDAIKWLEERAKNSPEVADAHCDLADGYLVKLQEGGNDYVMLGMLSQKADKAFDKTLEIDDHHWRGRFSKAVALSFWPPNLGKQGEAINHFQVLIEQQKGQTPNAGHAMPHMFLGNMYSQQGNMTKAKASWQSGLAADPGNEQLKKLIANAGN
ncbi:MAG: tetratricopeptide (TPR) repeat protein [Planctomycetota bacterium]|jgi:tetratricopeptide (TPR) repeat protein